MEAGKIRIARTSARFRNQLPNLPCTVTLPNLWLTAAPMFRTKLQPITPGTYRGRASEPFTNVRLEDRNGLTSTSRISEQ